MIRLIVPLVIAFLLPFVLHGIVTLARGRGFQPLPTAVRGQLWIAAAGVGLALATLYGFMGPAPHALSDQYIPAHMDGSVLVPGRFVSRE